MGQEFIVLGKLVPGGYNTPLADTGSVQDDVNNQNLNVTLANLGTRIDIVQNNIVDAYTKTESDDKYQLKEQGKGLSTNDYTTVEKEKLAECNEQATNTNLWWQEEELYKEIDGVQSLVVTASQILEAAGGALESEIQWLSGLISGLQQQINELSSRLTGVTLTVSPQTATVGLQATITIGISTTNTATNVVLYRGDTQIYTSSTEGTSYSYTDTFTPATAGTFKYKVVATIGGITKENEISVSVSKQNSEIAWSYNNATVYTGYSGNQFPTLANPNNLAVTYESSNTSVATVNSSGVVTLVGAGAAQISAIFAGNGTYNASTVKYSLNVIQDAVNSLAWTGGAVSPSTLYPSGTATFTKGTITATYLSGKTENVTTLATVTAQNGTLSGTTYTAPPVAGTDVISVSYSGKTASNTLSVIIQERGTANIAWSSNNATVYIGSVSNSYPTLSNPNNLPITYRSSNTSAATIDSYGQINLEGPGATTITARFAGNAELNAKEVSYTLNVANDSVVSITWTGQSLSPSTLLPNGTATLTKGSVIATYLSGDTKNVTANATFTAQRGSISGTTYTAPATTGNDVISVSYGGKTAASSINVTVQEEPKLNVYFGHGATYGSATFTNTGEALHNNMSVTINREAGDYLFIKVDKRDTVNNLYLHNEGGGIFEYMEIALNAAVTDGEYKYYQSTSQYNAGVGIEYVINKV